MVGFHSLQGHNEQPLSFEVDLPILRNDGTITCTSGPKGMPHGSPGILRVSPKVRFPVFPNLKARCYPLYRHVNDARFIGRGFDGIFVTRLIQVDRAAISIEAMLLVVKTIIFQRV